MILSIAKIGNYGVRSKAELQLSQIVPPLILKSKVSLFHQEIKEEE